MAKNKEQIIKIDVDISFEDAMKALAQSIPSTTIDCAMDKQDIAQKRVKKVAGAKMVKVPKGISVLPHKNK